MMQHKPDEPARIVSRLLGSADPEFSCEECFDALDAYVELELSDTPAVADARMPRMRPHLLGCSTCRDDHDSLVALLTADRHDTA
jgi:hypothetical protein